MGRSRRPWEGDLTAEPEFLNLLPASLRRILTSRLRVVRAPRGRTVIGAGNTSTDVFFVLEGELQILLYSFAGREVSVRDIGPGDMFGELAAIDGLPRSATVIAMGDVRMLIMNQADFLACLEASPAASLFVARRLGAEVRRLTARIFELSALNVQARLHCELLRLARRDRNGDLTVNPAPTHAELASRIGTHREAVTREMRALVQMNVIRNRRRSLEFLDIEHLERVVSRQVGLLEAS